jgi:hypothetical protein
MRPATDLVAQFRIPDFYRAMLGMFEVVVPALRTYARTLQSLADELNVALEIAGSASMTPDAYSQKGRGFAAAIQTLADAGKDTLKAGVDALETAGQTMTDTATVYERRDDTAAERLNAITSEAEPELNAVRREEVPSS